MAGFEATLKGSTVRTLLLLAGLVATTMSFAQSEPNQKPEPSAADARYEALQEKVQEAFDTWREEQMEAQRKAREAAGKGGVTPAMSMMPPYGKFVPEFQAAAREFAGKDEAVRFLLWITQFGGTEEGAVESAATTLITDHLKSKELVGFAQMLPRLSRSLGEDQVTGMLDALIVKSPHNDVRGWAVFARIAPKIEDPTIEVGSAPYERAKRQLRDASAASQDEALIGRVKGLIAEREQLGIGQVSPDIEGVDLDGVKFKLSDYAGKVVLLDFWGDW